MFDGVLRAMWSNYLARLTESVIRPTLEELVNMRFALSTGGKLRAMLVGSPTASLKEGMEIALGFERSEFIM
jgi:hypothetical protein